jgi:hypothetical protein
MAPFDGSGIESGTNRGGRRTRNLRSSFVSAGDLTKDGVGQITPQPQRFGQVSEEICVVVNILLRRRRPPVASSPASRSRA